MMTIAGGLLLFFLNLTLNQHVHADEPYFTKAIANINGKALHIEIADTQRKRILGLSNRTTLDSNRGMLFSYHASKIRFFTMKNTEIPLSIAFINENYRIDEIIIMQPFNTQSYQSSKPSMYALEVNQGWFKQNDIQAGDTLAIQEN